MIKGQSPGRRLAGFRGKGYLEVEAQLPAFPTAQCDTPHPQGSARFSEGPLLVLEGVAAGADLAISWRLQLEAGKAKAGAAVTRPARASLCSGWATTGPLRGTPQPWEREPACLPCGQQKCRAGNSSRSWRKRLANRRHTPESPFLLLSASIPGPSAFLEKHGAPWGRGAP